MLSCLRTKEFLSNNGVDYESINVHGNPADGELRKLGRAACRSFARRRVAFAQTLTDVIRFLN
jgi:hypothetical protein